MIAKIHEIKSRLQGRLDETGAVAFEYVLIIGGVSAVIVAAIALGAPSLMTAVLDGTCGAINDILDTAANCTP